MEENGAGRCFRKATGPENKHWGSHPENFPYLPSPATTMLDEYLQSAKM
jgi:hypothetical protein